MKSARHMSLVTFEEHYGPWAAVGDVTDQSLPWSLNDSIICIVNGHVIRCRFEQGTSVIRYRGVALVHPGGSCHRLIPANCVHKCRVTLRSYSGTSPPELPGPAVSFVFDLSLLHVRVIWDRVVAGHLPVGAGLLGSDLIRRSPVWCLPLTSAWCVWHMVDRQHKDNE